MSSSGEVSGIVEVGGKPLLDGSVHATELKVSNGYQDKVASHSDSGQSLPDKVRKPTPAARGCTTLSTVRPDCPVLPRASAHQATPSNESQPEWEIPHVDWPTAASAEGSTTAVMGRCLEVSSRTRKILANRKRKHLGYSPGRGPKPPLPKASSGGEVRGVPLSARKPEERWPR